MAGIWNRIIPGSDRVAVHLLACAIDLGADATFSDAQILAVVNSQIKTPLDAAAQTDLLNIRAQAAVGNTGVQAKYLFRLHSLAYAAEIGSPLAEASFRTKLNIPNP